MSRWATGKLHTSAYDGVVRRLDPQRGEFELLLARDDAEFSAFDCTLDGSVLFLGDNGGNFEMVDMREKADASRSVNLHDKKLNTLHVSRSLYPPAGRRITRFKQFRPLLLHGMRAHAGCSAAAMAEITHHDRRIFQ